MKAYCWNSNSTSKRGCPSHVQWLSHPSQLLSHAVQQHLLIMADCDGITKSWEQRLLQEPLIICSLHLKQLLVKELQELLESTQFIFVAQVLAGA